MKGNLVVIFIFGGIYFFCGLALASNPEFGSPTGSLDRSEIISGEIFGIIFLIIGALLALFAIKELNKKTAVA